jgi:hypothetical protein
LAAAFLGAASLDADFLAGAAVSATAFFVVVFVVRAFAGALVLSSVSGVSPASVPPTSFRAGFLEERALGAAAVLAVAFAVDEEVGDTDTLSENHSTIQGAHKPGPVKRCQPSNFGTISASGQTRFAHRVSGGRTAIFPIPGDCSPLAYPTTQVALTSGFTRQRL